MEDMFENYLLLDCRFMFSCSRISYFCAKTISGRYNIHVISSCPQYVKNYVSDFQWYPKKFCLIKKEWDIHDFFLEIWLFTRLSFYKIVDFFHNIDQIKPKGWKGITLS